MGSPTLGILDLGAANRANIARALERCGARTTFVTTPDAIERCDALVVPGVANVAYIAAELDRLQLREPLVRAAERGVPLLGICAGFQLFFERSDEAPNARGLALFDGVVRALSAPRLPHMGWNLVEERERAPQWAYFAHGFAAPASSRCTVATTELDGECFASIARRDGILGAQFHPERRGAYGAAFLASFVALAKETACLQSA